MDEPGDPLFLTSEDIVACRLHATKQLPSSLLASGRQCVAAHLGSRPRPLHPGCDRLTPIVPRHRTPAPVVPARVE